MRSSYYAIIIVFLLGHKVEPPIPENRTNTAPFRSSCLHRLRVRVVFHADKRLSAFYYSLKGIAANAT
jgi:hypothetical protein